MEKVNELMNAPLGHLVKIGRLYYAAIEFLPQGNTKGNVCVGCSFRDDEIGTCGSGSHPYGRK